MALYELVVPRPTGSNELRYTDHRLTVGHRFEIDNCVYVVVARTTNVQHPEAADGFVCERLTGASE